jgi:hypothetical protein
MTGTMTATMTANLRRAAASCLHLSTMTALVMGGLWAGAGCSSSSGSSGGQGGTSGAGGAGADSDAAVDTGPADLTPTSCAGMAISLGSNVPLNNDPAKSRVMVDFTATTDTDLPIGNAARTIEFWAFVLGTSWRGDANTMFEYGNTTPANGGYGLDFGGAANTVDPYTNGTFDNDNQPSGVTDYMTDQWVHFAMTYDQTALTLYVNGNYTAGTQGARKMVAGGMLATVRTMLTIGGNPRGAYFNGALDEFRLWNVARTQEEIMANMNLPLVGDEDGLVGYWKFDDGAGTTAADSVTTAGHTAHVGTLMATSAEMIPTWIASTAPIHCR